MLGVCPWSVPVPRLLPWIARGWMTPIVVALLFQQSQDLMRGWQVVPRERAVRSNEEAVWVVENEEEDAWSCELMSYDGGIRRRCLLEWPPKRQDFRRRLDDGESHAELHQGEHTDFQQTLAAREDCDQGASMSSQVIVPATASASSPVLL
ncbi:hypothetical protein BKA70DRAFT_1255949, partial [Coprinopsis sp. MPI-PUGE-AT-0042]